MCECVYVRVHAKGCLRACVFCVCVCVSVRVCASVSLCVYVSVRVTQPH